MAFIRLDYWLVSDHLVNSQLQVEIIPTPLSDHDTLSLKVGSHRASQGPGLWRFNNLILAQKGFITQMKSIIMEVKEAEEPTDPMKRWEWLKFKIGEQARKFERDEYRKKRNHEETLHRKLKNVSVQLDEVNMHSNTNEDDDREEVLTNLLSERESICREIKELELSRANKTITRSNANWALNGERPTKYFMNLQKIRSKTKNITELIDDSGRSTTDPKGILDMEKRFFEKLYLQKTSENLIDLAQLGLHQEGIPQITDLDKQRLERPLSSEELKSALNQLNRNKCPGTDGITVEVYHMFWEDIQDLFCACIHQCIREGHFTTEQQRGVISLIPKKDADRRFVRNWRPITLLNTDYKIVTKAIAMRLQSCIKTIIHSDQTGFVKTRYIGSNLRTIQDVIDFTQMADTPDSDPYILSFDYEKAFDSVQWSIIRKALEIFGFGQSFRNLIGMILKDPETCIINAGYTSEYFRPTNGVRQGCCPSPLLFIIVAELLAIMIRKANNIRGITLGNTEYRISQFADDATCFVNSRTSAERVVKIMDNFAQFSGLRLNMQKSKVMSLSKASPPPSEVAGLQVTQRLHILGIWFSKTRNTEEHYLWNFQPNLQKMNNICTSWANRSLSLKGKITVFNSLVISLL